MAGDLFLREIGNRIRTLTGTVDTPARLGGDEFVILLSEFTDPKGAEILARRLAEAGTTYRALVDELRFTEARKLLQAPKARITDAAAAVGFDDPSHFARMFHRIGGISPREFRKAPHHFPASDSMGSRA